MRNKTWLFFYRPSFDVPDSVVHGVGLWFGAFWILLRALDFAFRLNQTDYKPG